MLEVDDGGKFGLRCDEELGKGWAGEIGDEVGWRGDGGWREGACDVLSGLQTLLAREAVAGEACTAVSRYGA